MRANGHAQRARLLPLVAWQWQAVLAKPPTILGAIRCWQRNTIDRLRCPLIA